MSDYLRYTLGVVATLLALSVSTFARPTPVPGDVDRRIVAGWRVEVAIAADRDTAAATAVDLQRIFPADSVYLERSGLHWRVRIGNHTDHDAAQRHAALVTEKTGLDAHVVSAMVAMRSAYHENGTKSDIPPAAEECEHRRVTSVILAVVTMCALSIVAVVLLL